MSIKLKSTWTEIKTQVLAKPTLSLQAILIQDHYNIALTDGSFTLFAKLNTNDPDQTADVNDFVTNFLPNANAVVDSKQIRGVDGTIIGNVSDKLKVTSAPGTGGSGSSGGPLSWSKKLRYVDMNQNNGGIPRDTKINDDFFSTVFRYDGKGILSRFVIKVDDIDDWFMRLIIDGEDIFEDPSGAGGTNGISTDDIMDEYELEDDDHQIFGLSADNKRHIMFIAPNEGIRYESFVEIQLKSDNSSQDDFRAGLVVLSKEE